MSSGSPAKKPRAMASERELALRVRVCNVAAIFREINNDVQLLWRK